MSAQSCASHIRVCLLPCAHDPPTKVGAISGKCWLTYRLTHVIELIVSLLARLLVPQVQMLRLGQARFRFIPIHHLLLCSSTSDGQLNLGVVTRP